MSKPLLPIELSAKRKSWRMADDHSTESDKKFAAVRGKILDRDDHTCQYCGFRSVPIKSGTSWQEVHHVDDDHDNNKESNLKTACCLCHQCFHLGLAGSKNGGIMIYCPEISQVDIQHMSRAIFLAITSGSDYAQAARRMFESLESRARYMEEFYAPGSSNPSFFGQAFLSMTEEQYENRHKMIEHVRLLPFPGRFKERIAFWIENTYKSSLPETWSKLIESQQ